MSDRLELVPCTIKDAEAFVKQHHRHLRLSDAPGLFAVACARDGVVVGVAVVGRPKARRTQDGWTAEVTRVATDGTPNACSMLYRAAWRACRALGYRRLVTYTLIDEPGTSLRAAGLKCLGERGGGSWSCKSRPRVDKHPLQTKIGWEITAALALLLACGCAASRSGGAGVPAASRAAARVAQLEAAPADSAWLRWTTPATTALGCGDSAGVQHDAVHAAILRLRGQAPAWRPGCEADSTCWALVRRQTTPDTVWSAWAAPGARCSVRVGSGEYVPDVTRSRCKAWRIVEVK